MGQAPNFIAWRDAFYREHHQMPTMEDAFQAGRNFDRERGRALNARFDGLDALPFADPLLFEAIPRRRCQMCGSNPCRCRFDLQP
jgi:hypothetical protein